MTFTIFRKIHVRISVLQRPELTPSVQFILQYSGGIKQMKRSSTYSTNLAKPNIELA